ncbi:hypothetical protein NL676_013764 [Syzygium grande]|nr:hypothetical protein NL676_013764 [Syzygium grande]
MLARRSASHTQLHQQLPLHCLAGTGPCSSDSYPQLVPSSPHSASFSINNIPDTWFGGVWGDGLHHRCLEVYLATTDYGSQPVSRNGAGDPTASLAGVHSAPAWLRPT